MLIIRTPLRISFFGGGTDYPSWFNHNEGSVINASINRYSYITSRWLPPFFEYKHRIRYYEKEETQTLEEIKHPSIRECAKFLNINKGIEIVHNSDLPSTASEWIFETNKGEIALVNDLEFGIGLEIIELIN